MNIYFCREKHEYEGLFVSAKSRGTAKSLFARHIECDFADVRCHISRRGLNANFEGVFLDNDTLLEMCGLKYDEESEVTDDA